MRKSSNEKDFSTLCTGCLAVWHWSVAPLHCSIYDSLWLRSFWAGWHMRTATALPRSPICSMDGMHNDFVLLFYCVVFCYIWATTTTAMLMASINCLWQKPNQCCANFGVRLIGNSWKPSPIPSCSHDNHHFGLIKCTSQTMRLAIVLCNDACVNTMDHWRDGAYNRNHLSCSRHTHNAWRLTIARNLLTFIESSFEF